LSLSLISDDDALPRGGPGREALNAYQSLTFTQKGALHTIFLPLQKFLRGSFAQAGRFGERV